MRVHRWTGLALAGFLVVVAGTGTILPFQVSLQRLLAPERFVAVAGGVDWLALRERAAERSGGLVDIAPLRIANGAAPVYAPVARPGAPPLGFDEIVLDPADGREIARGRAADPRDGAAQLIPFLYAVHENLAVGGWGELLLGLSALAWTVDCFVGLYLTLPRAPEGWWRRWRGAWALRWPPSSAFRLHMDLHRAVGLWLWGMMAVFAWTGVGFNLPAVYGPVMHALTGYEAPPEPPRRDPPHAPALGWAEALAAARARAAEAAAAQGFRIERERELRLLRASGRYALALRTDRDRSDDGENSWVTIDGDTGALLQVDLPTGQRFGNTLDFWLGMLHEAAFGGLAVRLLVSVSGVGIVVVTVTGVLIWWRKRRVRGAQGGF